MHIYIMLYLSIFACMSNRAKVSSSVIPDRIRRLRKELGLSQQKFAELVDLSVNFIAQIEAGLRNPSFKTLENIAKKSGVDINYFFNSNEGELQTRYSKRDLLKKVEVMINQYDIKDVYYLFSLIEDILQRFAER